MDTVFGPKVLPRGSPAIPLLEKNDTGRGSYISHLDRSPLRGKVLLFAIMLLMYIALFIIMVWRASKNYNVALAFLLNDFYYVETGVSKKLKNGFWSWCWMLMVASFDYFLLSTMWPFLRTFIKGQLWFRLCHGFHEIEVFLHAPTGKEYDDMLALPPAKFQHVWQMSLLHTVKRLLGGNVFITRCPPWEPCYTASMDAYRLAKDCVFDLKNWELSVWEKDEHQQWTVWEIWRHWDPSLSTMALDIMKKKLRAQGKNKFVADLEAVLGLQANLLSSPLSDPVAQGLIRSFTIFFTEEGFDLRERWIEAIVEADRIRNQPQQHQ